MKPVTFKADSIDVVQSINFHGRMATEFCCGGRYWKTPVSEDEILAAIDELTAKSKVNDLFTNMKNN